MRKMMFIMVIGVLLCSIANADKIAHYRFEGNTNDETGNYDGTGYGIGYDTGKIGQAAFFDGVSDYIELTDLGNIHEPISIAMWIHPDYDTSINQSLFGRNIGYGSTGYHYENELLIDGDSEYFKFGDRAGSPSGDSFVYSTVQHQLGQWQHVAVTRDTDNTIQFFINGQPAGSGVDPYDVYNTDLSYLLGVTNTGHYPYYHGLIDDVQIFNNVLTQQQIETIMIPEPATMALLALGAVLLRRKR